MAKITEINTTAAAIDVKDRRGRTLQIKRPNVLAQYKLVELLGPTAESRVYLAMATPLLFLQSIDGEPQNFANKRELEAVIQRLDDDGLAALNAGIDEHFSIAEEEVATAGK